MTKALSRLLGRVRKRKLIDVDVSEISLVDHAATGMTFAIVKRDAALVELLKPFADDEVEELLKAGDPAALKALREALKTLGPYVSGLPDDIAAAVKTLVALAAGPADGEGYPAKRKKKTDDRPEGERTDFDSEVDRAAFYKAHNLRKPLPDGGALDTVAEFIVGCANPKLLAKWQGRKIQKAVDDGDLELEDVVIDESEGEPHGQSKVLKGQEAEGGGDDEEQVDPWPSLGGILNR